MKGSHGTFGQDAQEKRDFPPQPEAGADGSDIPEPSLKLPAEIIFVTLSLLHLLHCTFPASSLDVVRISNMLPQSLHLYSYIGIIVSPMHFSVGVPLSVKCCSQVTSGGDPAKKVLGREQGEKKSLFEQICKNIT